MNQAADAIFVADPQRMEYLDVNEAAGRLVGLSRQELLAEGPLGIAKRLSGRTESEVRTVYQQLIAAHPDWRPRSGSSRRRRAGACWSGRAAPSR